MFRQGGRVVRSSTIIKVILSVAIVACAVSESNAQDQAGRVAILDVAKVFKQNRAFDAKVKAIKAEADQLKQQITQEQDRIKAAAADLRNMPAGEDRNNREYQLEQQLTKLRTQTRQQEAALLNREARVYFETYNEMQSVVSTMATEYGLSLVLRFDSEEIDPNNRSEVIKGVNRAVVFHRKLDLTSLVSDALNTRMAAAGGQNLK
jgi:Skp family chaperone for outer membrane proteins